MALSDVLKWLCALFVAFVLFMCSLCAGAYALVVWVSVYFGHARHGVQNHSIAGGLLLFAVSLFVAAVIVAFSPVWAPKLVRGLAALAHRAANPGGPDPNGLTQAVRDAVRSNPSLLEPGKQMLAGELEQVAKGGAA